MSAPDIRLQYPPQGDLCPCPQCNSGDLAQASAGVLGQPPQIYAQFNEMATSSNTTSSLTAWPPTTVSKTTTAVPIQYQPPRAHPASDIHRVDALMNPNVTAWPTISQASGEALSARIHRASSESIPYASPWNTPRSTKEAHDYIYGKWQMASSAATGPPVSTLSPVVQDTQIVAVDGEERTYFIVTRVRF